MRGIAAAVAAAAALSIAGCGSPKRDECRTLTTMINATADRVDKAQASPLDPSGLKALADVLEKSAGEAEALELSAADLTKHAKAYATLNRDVAKTAREMAAAGEANDRAKAQAASDEMEKLVANEPKLLAEVNKLCSAQ